MNRVFKSLAVLALTLTAASAFAKTDALSLVPNDAVSVGVVRLSEIRTSPLSSTLFEQTDKMCSNGDADRFLTDAGLAPTKDIDVIVVSTVPRTALGSEADVLVAADGRFNVDRLTKALLARGAVQKAGYLLLPNSEGSSKTGAVAFPDSRLALIGTEKAVIDALANRAAGGTNFLEASGLGRETSRIDPHATAWAIVDVTRAERLGHGPHMSSHNSSTSMVAGALKNMSTVALWATDTGDAVKLGAFGLSQDAETLQLVEDSIRGALSAARLAVQDKSPELVSVLRRFNVTHNDTSVTISGSVPADTLRNLLKKEQAAK
ncbi:MAG: hypothetical protein ACXV7D_07485 [Thermoanaerobaculia bacterium]